MHHQVFEDLPQSVQVLDGHLVADGLLVRRLALAKEAVCAGGRRTAVFITLMDQRDHQLRVSEHRTAHVNIFLSVNMLQKIRRLGQTYGHLLSTRM